MARGRASRALRNFDGPSGILDSGRTDVDYEDWSGHKLDREMLELLRKYFSPCRRRHTVTRGPDGTARTESRHGGSLRGPLPWRRRSGIAGCPRSRGRAANSRFCPHPSSGTEGGAGWLRSTERWRSWSSSARGPTQRDRWSERHTRCGSCPGADRGGRDPFTRPALTDHGACWARSPGYGQSRYPRRRRDCSR